MSAHTKGPWRVGIWVCGPSNDALAIACNKNGVTDECRANAHLIAAAPDMLEALRAGVRMEWARRTREAISDPLHPGLLGAQIELEKATHEFATLRDAAIAKAKGEQP